MIVIIDYGMGNLRSVQKSFERLKVEVEISSDIKKIREAQKLILPGVGHFANGMKRLKELSLVDLLHERVLVDKIPILGICLGMQLMANFSEEGNSKGLGWIDAEAVKFKPNSSKYKIPHMGWNNMKIKKNTRIVNNIKEDSLFYFVHSYHLICNNQEDVLGETDYIYPFISAIEKNNIFGFQFHPEKSQDDGLQLLENFVRL